LFKIKLKTKTMHIKRIARKIGKWTGIVIISLLVLLVIIYGFSSWKFNNARQSVYSFPPVNIEIPNDSASIANGKHLFAIYGCRECHGVDLRGKVMIDDPLLGYIRTANLTSGKGGIPVNFNDQEWLNALKHGINKERKPLIAMPSQESTKIPDDDLADLIAYCKNSPPVDNELGEIKAAPLAKILYAFGLLDVFSVKNINHEIYPIAKPEEVISDAYGAKLTLNCTGCHRENFEGGPPLAPGHPPVPNITSTGRPGKWTEEQFMNTLRTGVNPYGHALDNNLMPWKRFAEYSDYELKAIRAYILSFPKTNTKILKSEK
jgi:mono/diheme cytochrome c family protein